MTTYTAILSPDPESGVYTAICPSLPGAIAEGESREGALDALALVMETWLELAQHRGFGPAVETPSLIARAVGEVLEDRDAEGWDREIQLVSVSPHRTPVAV